MGFNGSGTFLVNSSGQPFVFNTTIDEVAMNALSADIATGLSTCITKDGQTVTTAVVDFAAGLSAGSITNSTGLAASTYTPTWTDLTNTSARSPSAVPYIRVGNFVIVGVYGSITPTSTATTGIYISLPIASTIASATDAVGSASCSLGDSGPITGDGSGHRASYSFAASSTANLVHAGVFIYKVI